MLQRNTLIRKSMCLNHARQYTFHNITSGKINVLHQKGTRLQSGNRNEKEH